MQYEALEFRASTVPNGYEGLLRFLKDQRPFAYKHCLRVGDITCGFCKALESDGIIDGTAAQQIGFAGVVHDIGKALTPIELLDCKQKLSSMQYIEVQKHTINGIILLQTVYSPVEPELDKVIRNVITFHHEWFDGSGYPYHLCGLEIPFEARVVSLADSFEALTSCRSYKPAYTVDMAIEVMRNEGVTHFDPELLNRFIRYIAMKQKSA